MVEPQPTPAEASETLSETASKLERLRELTCKYNASEGSKEGEIENEQALETHEVIELQAFVRHKEWIEEKIKFLESLPPIDIFAGVDELPKTHDQITTLATRAQLDAWVAEHDRIDKETEALDAGDLKKLKALTKAATQRNLSREDTDLIEIALTTLFGFDKLLHLLRDRSEQLDLLDTRLTWEEQRAQAYSTRNDLLSQIQSFLHAHARWRPDIYHTNKTVIFTTGSSMPSESTQDPLSRSARYKLFELVSREIVQLSSRISSLRHGPVLTSGKALDKLIEDGRQPVPDAMLDEQDRVEEKCEKDLASVGKFLMTVNMQWQKADETFAETRKDTATLGTLSDEVKAALAEFPSRKRANSFGNRFDSLKKRLQPRLEQSLMTSISHPRHPLFPDQGSANSEVVRALSDELSRARSDLSSVENAVNSYRVGCDVVEEVEELRKEVLNLQEEVSTVTDRLQSGFDGDDGDGRPPDLAQTSCVESTRFSTFLANLPPLYDKSSQLEEYVSKTVKRARLNSLRLQRPGITSDFKQEFMKELEELESRVLVMLQTRDDVSMNASLLEEARRIWSAMDEVTKGIGDVNPDLREALLRNYWKQQTGSNSAPPTPESPTADLPTACATTESINARISSLKERLERDVNAPLLEIRSTIPPSLYDFICARRLAIERSLFDSQSILRLLVDVHAQRYAMETIREEVHTLEGRIEDSKVEYDDHFDSMLKVVENEAEALQSAAAQIDEELKAKEQSLSRNVDSVQAEVTSLVDSLPSRVPLIARRPLTSAEGAPPGGSRTAFTARLPFDPSAIDRNVRGDTNAYAMRLTSGVKSLQQKRSFGEFYRAARGMSKQIVIAHKSMRVLADQLEQLAKELEELEDAHPQSGDDDALSAITSLKDSLEGIEKVDANGLRGLVLAMRENVSLMEAVPNVQDDSITRSVLNARLQSLEEVTKHSQNMLDMLRTLKTDVVRAEQRQLAYLAEISRKEKETAEAELQEQARRQQEQKEAEQRAREKLEMETRFRELDESTPKRHVGPSGFAIEEDVFGSGSPSRQAIDRETAKLLAFVRSLRRQLMSIGLNSVVRPSGASRHRSSSASLPYPEAAESMASDFALLVDEMKKLPISAENVTADTELRSLRLEMEASRELLNRVQQLARLQSSIGLCDATFSTFLDYIDSYPNAPQVDEKSKAGFSKRGPLETPQERLSAKMAHAKGLFSDMNEHFAPVADDPRAITEHNRLKQTWEELTEMSMEKISGLTSRAASVLSTYNSSGRNSSASSRSVNGSDGKRSRYSNLSIGSRDGLLAPAMPSQRRATSASSAGSSSARQSHPRAPRPSLPDSKSPSNRSVSGPMKLPIPTTIARPSMSSLFNSTFASRQRTSSISSSTSIPTANRSTSRRMSSVMSDASRPTSPSPSITGSRGTWSRAPRQSLSTYHRASTPDKSPRKPRQKYVANPKYKLDVALGDVINNLPVDINVEAVEDTWKDKSGKYWIGGNEPKLCFCRILRSQTVMVRVGGGWTELSKFIKDHFADLFRVLPETPPRPGSREQRWISAATLQSAEEDSSLTKSIGSPDSITRNLPSFAISTPDGTQKSASPGSSPLTPLQFIRRADANASEISLSTLALSNDPSTTGISTTSIHPGRRRMSSVSSKFAWKP